MSDTFCEIVSLAFAVTGMISVLLVLTFKVMTWRENGITVILPMRSSNDGIDCKIRHLREIFEFLGMHKKCRIAVINYGASKRYCQKLISQFDNGDFIYIVDASSPAADVFDESDITHE